MRELDVSKNLLISSFPPSILNMNGKEILNSLKNSLCEKNSNKISFNYIK
jgi:hypothetical protein